MCKVSCTNIGDGVDCQLGLDKMSSVVSKFDTDAVVLTGKHTISEGAVFQKFVRKKRRCLVAKAPLVP